MKRALTCSAAFCTVCAAVGTVFLFQHRPTHALIFLLASVAGLLLLLALHPVYRLTKALQELDLQDLGAAEVPSALLPFVQRLQAQNEQTAHEIEALRQASAARDTQRREFTANVSHEMKTPLTTISGTAEILQSGLVKPEDIPHFAGNIYHEAQRLSTLVNDIIKLSQLDENKDIYEKSQVELYALCEDTISFLQEEAARKHIAITLHGTRAEVLGVERILDEMIYNLCDNAVKYTKEGGHVEVTVFRERDAVRLCVQDNGIGIPPEHQSRVFERFYRVDKSHSRQVGGTGLGLSIVKHGALFHNAELTLQSREGVGTTITLRFPV